MKKLILLAIPMALFISCGDHDHGHDHDGGHSHDHDSTTTVQDSFVYQVDKFGDTRIIRYKIPGWEGLSAKKKALTYYLVEAGLAGRDIMYDMNYRHNLEIRKTVEAIVKANKDKASDDEWEAFMVYAKRMWFSNGIHHHYSQTKFVPEFSQAYFEGLMNDAGISMSADAMAAIFDPKKDAKKVSKEKGADLVLASAVNFFDPDVTQAEVEAFYDAKSKNAGDTPIWYGLNSKVVRGKDGKVEEKVWKVGGMYGSAIERIVGWLEKAKTVAESDKQAHGFDLLIKYFQTGDLKTWDDYNIAWVSDTGGDVDYILGFIEVYNDPLGKKGSFETIVQVKDMDASAKMTVLQENAQWFETNSSIMEEHKKENVVGITYSFINVAGEAGDASPSTPIGVNLPNSDWIRATHGSKSVSLGNIVDAYDKASSGGALEEFAHDAQEIEFSKKYSDLTGKLHTALHEVIGHASGKLNPGVGTPKQTLKNYASTLEEGRADLVALYYIYDKKMVDLGLMPSLDVGKAEYDSYIRNGLMYQMRRLELGDVIEEDHMRNRQLVAGWVFEKGEKDDVISKVVRDGKTYFEINDYDKLRVLFGDLLREIQRIKSEGDYQAGEDLVEKYGVQVDPDLHAEVLKRSEKLKTPPYGGFVNPRLVPETDADGNITDVKVEYPDNFVEQMLEYGDKYSHLPVNN